MHKEIMITLVILTIGILSPLTIPADAGGIGVGPAIIWIENALRDADYNRTITIHNYANITINVSFQKSGEVNEWINFYNRTNTSKMVSTLQIPSQSSRKIGVNINIPSNISNDFYTGTIFVAPLTGNQTQQDFGTSVMLKMPVEIRLNVTGTQTLNATVESVIAHKTEVGYPLDIHLFIKNTGNVMATPKISLNITKGNFPVEKIIVNDQSIEPGKIKHIIIQWNTTGMIAGTYDGSLNILLGDKTLLNDTLDLEILPQGELTSKGNLTSLQYQGSLEKGSTIKLYADFVNTGQLQVTAKFIGEIYLDNKLIDTIESSEATVRRSESKRLTSYLKLEKNGKYTIKGYVSFTGNTTSISTLSFQIGKTTSINPLLIGGITIAAILSLSILFLKRKQLKNLKFIKKINLKNRKK